MMKQSNFSTTIRHFYRTHGRPFPWRETSDPYAITLSEIMLQQTQTARVLPYYTRFLTRFPNWESLAQAELSEVLTLWQGLGYNRRAKNLLTLAREVIARFEGKLPADEELLKSLPGIGNYTAAAIMVFAFRKKAVLVETNVRTVILHHFYEAHARVEEREVMCTVSATLPRTKFREWYYGLMDYGVHLKSQHGNLNVKVNSYRKQSAFKGSRREVRGAIIRVLVTEGRALSPSVLIKNLKPFTKEAIFREVSQLAKEGLVMERAKRISLAGG